MTHRLFIDCDEQSVRRSGISNLPALQELRGTALFSHWSGQVVPSTIGMVEAALGELLDQLIRLRPEPEWKDAQIALAGCVGRLKESSGQLDATQRQDVDDLLFVTVALAGFDHLEQWLGENPKNEP